MEPDTTTLVAILIGLGILFVVRWLLFTAIIWGMLRVQSLNFTWPGLLLTTALASVAYFIPLGILAAAVAFVVVYAGLKKVTQAEHTDLMFTIVIGNAVMYVAGLWLLAAVLPDFRDLRGTDTAAGESEAGTGMLPDYAGIMKQASNTLTEAADRGTGRSVTADTGRAPASSGASKTAESGGLQLKGVTVMGSGSLAMIRAGERTVSVSVKESITMREGGRIIRYVCESISTNGVVLRVQRAEPPRRIELRLE
jgi:hypothetical protein